jgi:hypothetical protein
MMAFTIRRRDTECKLRLHSHAFELSRCCLSTLPASAAGRSPQARATVSRRARGHEP